MAFPYGTCRAVTREILAISWFCSNTILPLLKRHVINFCFWLYSRSTEIDQKMRDDLERLKKIRNHRGLRHYWGLRVRGQHTKTTGRRGKTVGVSKKKG